MNTKITFEFGEDDDVNLPKVYTNALNMYFVLNELKERMRSIVKYEEIQYKDLSGFDAIDKFREEFFEKMTAYGIDLDSLS